MSLPPSAISNNAGLAGPSSSRGLSQGAAAAIYAAATLGTRVSGYILESPYRDARTAVRNRTAAYLPLPLSGTAYAGLSLVGPWFLPDLERMAPIEYITSIPATTPILLLGGSQDERAQPEELAEMQARAGGHAQLVLFEGAGHVLLYRHDPDRYHQAVSRLIAAAASR